MSIRTTHIREMLQDAIEACVEAEKTQLPRKAERLLKGAAVNARHASAEIEDELFRAQHPEGYLP